MNKKINKNIARLVIAVLLISTVAAIFPAAQGAGITGEELTPDDTYGWLDYIYVNGNLEDENGEPDMDVYIGQKENTLEPYFVENVSHTANITDQRIMVNDVVRLTGDDWTSMDAADWEDGTSSFEWIEDEETTDTGPFAGTVGLKTFEFDVTNEATTGIYRIPLRLKMMNETGSGTWEGTHTITEYIWIEIAGNADVAADGISIKPGIEFEEKDVLVENQGDQNLQDVELTLDVSGSDLAGEGVFIHDPDETAYVDIITHTFPDTENFKFRFTAPLDAAPGDYEVDYTLVGTRENDEIEVIEHGTLTITVEKVAELTAEIEEESVMQGTTKTELTVEFTNTGNLDLERVSVRADTDGDYYFMPKDYYTEGSATSTDPWFDLGDLDQDDSDSVVFVYGMNKDLQIGIHELQFDYSAYYYDADGEVVGDGQSQYVETGTWDDPEELLANTNEPVDTINVTENPDYNPIRGQGIGVNDYSNPVRITDMGYQTIQARIYNSGHVDYSDVMVELDTSDTPFNPPSGESDMIEMDDEVFTLGTGWEESTRTVTFGVVVDTTFIEDRLANDNPAFDATLHITGQNTDMLEEEEFTVDTRGRVAGMGPKIMVRQPTEENEVKAGKSFELTYELENVGDAPVRDLQVMIEPYTPNTGYTQFVEGQEAVYYQQAITGPGAYVSTVEPEQQVLNPGESTTVTFHMKPSSDMQEGATYFYDIGVNGEEETGDYNTGSGVTIRTAESESTKPGMVDNITGNMAWLLIAIIAGVFFALGMSLLSKKGKAEPAGGEQEPEPVAAPVQEEPVYEEETVEEEPDWGEEPFTEEEPVEEPVEEPIEEEEEFIGEEEDEEVW